MIDIFIYLEISIIDLNNSSYYNSKSYQLHKRASSVEQKESISKFFLFIFFLKKKKIKSFFKQNYI